MDKNKIHNSTVLISTIYDIWIVILETFLLTCLFVFMVSPSATPIFIGLILSIILLIHFSISWFFNFKYLKLMESFRNQLTNKGEGKSKYINPKYYNNISTIIVPIYWIFSRLFIPYILVNVGISGHVFGLGLPVLFIFTIISTIFNYIRRSGINGMIVITTHNKR